MTCVTLDKLIKCKIVQSRSYLTNGPHHRASGHFALGQHAVERLNQTRLNTNEIFINQNAIQQPQQAQAEASYATPQFAISSQKSIPQSSTKLFPINHRQHHQQYLEPQKHVHFAPTTIPQNGRVHQMIYQHPQQIPLIYEYHQNAAAPLNYFHQQPHDVIYHQQPIVSMSEFPPVNPTFLPTPASPPQVSIDGNIEPQISIIEQQQESSNTAGVTTVLVPEEFQPHLELLRVEDDKSAPVATPNQLNAKIQDDAEQASQKDDQQFNAPIVVGDEGKVQNDATVIVQQKNKVFENYQQPQHQPQINVQILTDVKQDGNFRVEVTQPTTLLDNQNNYQYLVEDQNQDQNKLDSTQSTRKEAPSRQFLRNFKKFNSIEQSTTVRTIETSSTRGCCRDSATTTACCDETKQKVDKVKVTTQTASNNLLAPMHAGLRLTNEKLDDCIDGQRPDKIVEVRKNVEIKETYVTSTRKPSYGDRIVIEPPKIISPPPVVIEKEVHRPVFISTPSPPSTTVVTKIVDRPVYIKSPPEVVEKVIHHATLKEKPIFIEKIIKQQVAVDRPVFVKSPPETKIVQQPVFIEKQVVKEVKVPVEKTKTVHQPIYQTVEKPVFIEKVVNQPVEIEKIVEKPVVQTVEKLVEKPVYIEKIVDRPVIQTVEKPVIHTVEKIIDRPVEKIVDRPIIQTVEKVVEKPVYIEKVVEKPVVQTVEKPIIQTVEKIIDRPVPYAVPYEKHFYHKPDFHVIAKTVPHKHKLFDFDSLFGFLTKKQEVKHIYVPANPHYQLSQINKHQLHTAHFSSIEPVKEAPLLDYSQYATSHLNPIKPVYGVPSTVLQPVNTGYSAPDPYAGNFNFSTYLKLLNNFIF